MDLPHLRSDGVRAADEHSLHSLGRASDRPYLNETGLDSVVRKCWLSLQYLRASWLVSVRSFDQGGKSENLFVKV